MELNPLQSNERLSILFPSPPKEDGPHIIVRRPLPKALTLSYWFIGDDPTNIHHVTVNSHLRVKDLQQSIKQKHRDLEIIESAKFKLWLVIVELFILIFFAHLTF